MRACAPYYRRYDFTRLVTLFGRFYQIRDDYANLNSTSYSSQKGFCEDLEEGKFSVILIHALGSLAAYERDHMLAIIRRQQFQNSSVDATIDFGSPRAPQLSRELKLHVLELMEKAGSMVYTRKLLSVLETELEAEIEKLERQTGVENSIIRLILVRLGLDNL
jgi:ophiobolin F synthase